MSHQRRSQQTYQTHRHWIRLFLAINWYYCQQCPCTYKQSIFIIFYWIPSLSLENVASDSFPFFGASDQISTFHFWSNRMKWKHSNVEDSSLSMEHRNLFLTKPTAKSHPKRLKITWWLHTVPEKIANYSWNLDCKVPFFSEQKQRSSATNVLTCKTM